MFGLPPTTLGAATVIGGPPALSENVRPYAASGAGAHVARHPRVGAGRLEEPVHRIVGVGRAHRLHHARIHAAERREVGLVPLRHVVLLAADELELHEMQVDRVGVGGRVDDLPDLGRAQLRELARRGHRVDHARHAHVLVRPLGVVLGHHERLTDAHPLVERQAADLDDRLRDARIHREVRVERTDGSGPAGHGDRASGDTELHDLTGRLGVDGGARRIRRLALVAQLQRLARPLREVDDDLDALAGTDDELAAGCRDRPRLVRRRTRRRSRRR